MDIPASNRQSQIFQVLSEQIETAQQNDQPRIRLYESPSPHPSTILANQESHNSTIKQMQSYIMELEAKNRELTQKQSQLHHQLVYLSREGIKYAQWVMRLQDQIAAKQQQIQLLTKQLADRNQKYIIIESEDPMGADEKSVKPNRQGIKVQDGLQTDVIQNLLRQHKDANGKQPETIEEKIQKYLINYVLEISKNGVNEGLEEMLTREKERITEYVGNFNVMMEQEKTPKNWSNWEPLRAISNLFRK